MGCFSRTPFLLALRSRLTLACFLHDALSVPMRGLWLTAVPFAVNALAGAAIGVAAGGAMYFVAFFSVLTLLFVLRLGPRARDIQGSEPEASGSENDLVELAARRGEGGGCFAVPPPRTTYHA